MTDAILMATYNAGPWLEAQLRSILEQSAGDWCLLVSDDGSTDGTLEHLQALAAADPRVELLPKRDGASGHAGNFEYLLDSARQRDFRFLFLSDQDDLWAREKLTRQRDTLTTAQACCSDLQLIDAAGEELGNFWQTMGVQPAGSLAALIAQNSVVGCTLALRSELLALALPFPDLTENHDWWLALVAMASGTLTALPEPLVQYRQHGANTVGVRKGPGALGALPSIIERQRRVLDARLLAVTILIQRLETAGLAVPATLQRYSERYGRGLAARLGGLWSGEFSPDSVQLRTVQSLALLLPRA